MKLLLVFAVSLMVGRVFGGPILSRDKGQLQSTEIRKFSIQNDTVKARNKLPSTKVDPFNIDRVPIPPISKLPAEPTSSADASVALNDREDDPKGTFHIHITTINGSVDAGYLSVVPGMFLVARDGVEGVNATRFSIDEKGRLFCPALNTNAYYVGGGNSTMVGVVPLEGIVNATAMPCSLNSGPTQTDATGVFSCRIDSWKLPQPMLCGKYWGFNIPGRPETCRYGPEEFIEMRYKMVNGL